MHIDINDNTTLGSIGRTFADFYPNLKIEFFKNPHQKYEPSPLADMYHEPDTTIGDIRETHISSLLEIQPWYKIGQVEKEFLQRFGLSVQIFFREKDKWRQTTGMDDLTLKYLNILSRNSSDEIVLSELDPESEEE